MAPPSCLALRPLRSHPAEPPAASLAAAGAATAASVEGLLQAAVPPFRLAVGEAGEGSGFSPPAPHCTLQFSLKASATLLQLTSLAVVTLLRVKTLCGYGDSPRQHSFGARRSPMGHKRCGFFASRCRRSRLSRLLLFRQRRGDTDTMLMFGRRP